MFSVSNLVRKNTLFFGQKKAKIWSSDNQSGTTTPELQRLQFLLIYEAPSYTQAAAVVMLLLLLLFDVAVVLVLAFAVVVVLAVIIIIIVAIVVTIRIAIAVDNLAATYFATFRTSIFPVTAAVMRAV